MDLLYDILCSRGDVRWAVADDGGQIATEHSPYAQTSTVGVWIDAGSRAESDRTNGNSYRLKHHNEDWYTDTLYDLQARPTSSNISPSKAPKSAPSPNSSSKSRTWAVT